jgi:hypothetical protein
MNRMKYTCSIQDCGVVDAPFEIQALSLSEGLGFDAPLKKEKDSLKRVADSYIHSH